MIEQAIYFGLGFVVAGLAALGFTPVLWARALRLTRRRLQVQIPVSMQEILADRDLLRAEFAVSATGLEQEMERVRAAKAGDLAELGRRAVQIHTLTQELAEARGTLAAQDARISQLTREAAEAATGLAAAQMGLQQNHAWFEQRLEQHEALKKAKAGLEHMLEQTRSTVGTLQRRISGLELTIEDAGRSRSALLHNLDSARQQAELTAEERDRLVNQLSSAQSAQETLRRRLAAETARVADLIEAKRTLRAEADSAKVKLRLAENGRAASASAPRDGRDRDRAESLRESFAGARWRMAATQPGGASPLTSGGASPLAPSGASPLAPSGASALTPGGSGAPSPGGASAKTPEDGTGIIQSGGANFAGSSSSEADLRATIHRLGLAVAAMMGDEEPLPEPEAAAVPAAAKRPPPPLRGGPPPARPASVSSE